MTWVILSALAVQAILWRFNRKASVALGFIVTTGILVVGLAAYLNGGYMVFLGAKLHVAGFVLLCIGFYRIDMWRLNKLNSESTTSPAPLELAPSASGPGATAQDAPTDTSPRVTQSSIASPEALPHPLLLAVRDGQFSRVLELLDGDYAVNDTDANGNTALMVASQRGDIQLVRALLAKGADRTLRNHSGQSAVDLAAHRGIRKELEPRF